MLNSTPSHFHISTSPPPPCQPLPFPLASLLALPLLALPIAGLLPLPLPIPKDPKSRLNILKHLLHSSPRRPIRRAEHKLSAQVPALRQLPLRGDLVAEALLVVLQAAAETGGCECGPDYWGRGKGRMLEGRGKLGKKRKEGREERKGGEGRIFIYHAYRYIERYHSSARSIRGIA